MIRFEEFLNIFIEVLVKYAPMKIKYIRANQSNTNKHLKKPITKRSRLHNIFLKEKTENSNILQYTNTRQCESP